MTSSSQQDPSTSEARPTAPAPRTLDWIRRKLRHFGPIIIVAGLTVGPGSTVTGVQAGAEMGYDVLWLMILIALFSFVFIDMGVRIGMAFPGSLITAVRAVIGRSMGLIFGIVYVVLSMMFMTGSILGAVIGL